MSCDEDQEIGAGNVWVQCDKCQNRLHFDCCGSDIGDFDSNPFFVLNIPFE